MVLKIDFDSDIPIYVQIKNQVVEGIARGELEEGEELPSVRGLADDIGVNMHTVNKAYSLLKDDGYIKIDRRKGAFVSLSLKGSNEVFRENLNYELEYYMAECFNRSISKEDIKSYIDAIFSGFKKEDS